MATKSKTSSAAKMRYDEKTYVRYVFRVRKNSDLYEEITNFKSKKDTSFNYLVTELLCKHFDVSRPDPTVEW